MSERKRKSLTWKEKRERAKKNLREAAEATMHWEMGLLCGPPTARQRRLMYPEAPQCSFGTSAPIAERHFGIYCGSTIHLLFS